MVINTRLLIYGDTFFIQRERRNEAPRANGRTVVSVLQTVKVAPGLDRPAVRVLQCSK